jgi:hypothetical protein
MLYIREGVQQSQETVTKLPNQKEIPMSSAASLFSSIARGEPSVRYVIHRDHASQCWNVFKKVGFAEEFVQNFENLEDARDFCDINNGVLEALEAGEQ